MNSHNRAHPPSPKVYGVTGKAQKGGNEERITTEDSEGTEGGAIGAFYGNYWGTGMSPLRY